MAKKKLSERKRIPQTGSSNRAADKNRQAKPPSPQELRANRTDKGKGL